VRVNNRTDQTNYHVAGEYRWGDRTTVGFSGQSFASERGLPGMARSQNVTAAAADDRQLLDLNLRRRFTERLHSELSFGYSRYFQHFNDTGLAGRPPQVDSEYRNRIMRASARTSWRPLIGQTVSVMLQVNDERLDHRDLLRDVNSMGESRRTDLGLGLVWLQEARLSSRWGGVRAAVEGSLRRDEITVGDDEQTTETDSTSQDAGYWSHAVGASVTAGSELRATLRGRYGKSLNLPSMNALFWKGDARSEGNPYLRPERSEHSEGSIELQWRPSKALLVSASGAYFHTNYRDLVQWQPNFRGIWKPYNLAGAQVTGHEDVVSVGLFDRLIELRYQNTVTTALNREAGLNSYGMVIRYTPAYQTLATARLDLDWWWLAYDIRWVGQRHSESGA
jgi:outer membrane cobalamin receptor